MAFRQALGVAVIVLTVTVSDEACGQGTPEIRGPVYDHTRTSGDIPVRALAESAWVLDKVGISIRHDYFLRKDHGRDRLSRPFPAVAVGEKEMAWERTDATLGMAVVNLRAEERIAQKATVMVCMDFDQHVLMGVRPLASSMFERIGVRIDWRERDACPAGAHAIQVRLSYNSSSLGSPKALAFAQPYQDRIVVFLDRVQQLSRDGGPPVLAHVLVHEITHVLEGTTHHSATGLMKEKWDDQDYAAMRRKPLPFAPEDVRLINNGLKLGNWLGGHPPQP